MPVIDLRAVPEDARLDADVCIIGSGPAGTTLAEELAGRRSVIVLESGGAEPGDADDLNRILSVGAPRVMDQRLVRNRVLGGSSSTWWGRAAVFDEMDFAPRPWVTDALWPVGREELEAPLARAARRLRLGVDDNSTDPALLERNRVPFDPARLVGYRWTYSRADHDPEQPVRFGSAAAALTSARVYVHATVLRLVASTDGRRVTEVRVRARDGGIRVVRAASIVLAAGGIENARLLLASDDVDPRGLGNRHDQVGRYLMDHLRGPIGVYAPDQSVAAQRALGAFRMRSGRGVFRVVPGAALSPSRQREEQLLQAAVWTEGPIADDDAAEIARRLRTRPRLADVLGLTRSGPLAVESVLRTKALGRSSLRRRSSLQVHCIVEQAPDRRSRVTLGEELDASGVPVSVIDWRFGEQEARTARRIAALFAAESERLGLPVPAFDPMIRDGSATFLLPDVAHPTGTTRMSARPEDGVVDAQCRVHGVENLWIAGSSVFPTSGHANPTQMIVAFAMRLADQLSAA